MKKLAIAITVVGALSLVAGVVFRLLVQRVPIAPGGVNPAAMASFAQSCFLLAIALCVVKMAK